MPDELEKNREQQQEEGSVEEKHVDADWKEEARREKERLAKESDEGARGAEGRTAGRPRELPEPSFELMVTNLAIQALIAMGAIANPVTRKQERNLDQAKHTIDLLGIVEQKTKGNLTDEERRHLDGTLYDLRTRYLGLSGS